MALAFERPAELRRAFRRPRTKFIHLDRLLAHCAVTGAFAFVAGSLIFL